VSGRQIGSPISANKKWLRGKSDFPTMKIVVGNFISVRSNRLARLARFEKAPTLTNML
jgi:hypothetical protein